MYIYDHKCFRKHTLAMEGLHPRSGSVAGGCRLRSPSRRTSGPGPNRLVPFPLRKEGTFPGKFGYA